MKQVKSKITGNIGELDFDSKTGIFIVVIYDLNTKETVKNYYKSLEDLCEEWCDYEEPKEYWYYDTTKNGVDKITHLEDKEKDQEIGNYFETREEAKQAVEKLKAWKRLKDHNLRIERGQRLFVNADNKLTSQKPLFVMDTYNEVEDDLDLLLGGEE